MFLVVLGFLTILILFKLMSDETLTLGIKFCFPMTLTIESPISLHTKCIL